MLQEKKIGNFNMENFARLIAKNSKVQVIIIQNKEELGKYFQKNLIKNEIIIGMGLGLFHLG